MLLECLVIEVVFWREIDRARFLPWLLELTLFLHLLVLDFLSIFLVSLSTVADLLRHLMNRPVVLFVLLARFSMQRAKFDHSSYRRTGVLDSPIDFLIVIKTHA